MTVITEPDERELRRAVGGAIRLRRQTLRIRAVDLAQAIGLGRDVVSKYECGDRIPGLVTFVQIAEALGWTAGDLWAAVEMERAARRYAAEDAGLPQPLVERSRQARGAVAR